MTSSLIGNGVYDAHLIGSKDGGGLRHPVLPRGNSDSSPLVHFRESPQDSFPPAAVQTQENSYSDSEVQDGLPEMTDSILSQRSDASSSTIGALQRGRSIFRPPTSASAPDVRVLGQDETAGVSWRQMSGSRTRLPTSGSHSRPSQSRTRSVVFLSISAGLGLRGLYKRSATAMHSTGKDIAWKTTTSHEINDFSLDLGTVRTSGEILPPPPIDYSLLVGRVAAWLCVCFYLTSRMPQICKSKLLTRSSHASHLSDDPHNTGKNFRRRSVEVRFPRCRWIHYHFALTHYLFNRASLSCSLRLLSWAIFSMYSASSPRRWFRRMKVGTRKGSPRSFCPAADHWPSFRLSFRECSFPAR